MLLNGLLHKTFPVATARPATKTQVNQSRERRHRLQEISSVVLGAGRRGSGAEITATHR